MNDIYVNKEFGVCLIFIVGLTFGLLSCNGVEEEKVPVITQEIFSGYWSDFRGAFSPPQNPAIYSFQLRGDTLLGNTTNKQITIQATLQDNGSFSGRITHRGGQNNVVVYPEPEHDFRMLVKLFYNNNRELDIWLMKQE